MRKQEHFKHEHMNIYFLTFQTVEHSKAKTLWLSPEPVFNVPRPHAYQQGHTLHDYIWSPYQKKLRKKTTSWTTHCSANSARDDKLKCSQHLYELWILFITGYWWVCIAVLLRLSFNCLEDSLMEQSNLIFWNEHLMNQNNSAFARFGIA